MMFTLILGRIMITKRAVEISDRKLSSTNGFSIQFAMNYHTLLRDRLGNEDAFLVEIHV
jgi:hypothetical protein